jgi:hypothetical protein
LTLARRDVKDKFPTPTVQFTAVLQNRQVFLPDPIGAAIPGYRNVIKREAEKVLKYKDLKIEIQGLWNVEEKVTQYNNTGGKYE